MKKVDDKAQGENMDIDDEGLGYEGLDYQGPGDEELGGEDLEDEPFSTVCDTYTRLRITG